MQKETPIISCELLNLLICPIKGVTLEVNQEKNALINEKYDVFYPIIDGIPLMILK